MNHNFEHIHCGAILTQKVGRQTDYNWNLLRIIETLTDQQDVAKS